MSTSKIGFIGLDIMGGSMAGHLIKAGGEKRQSLVETRRIELPTFALRTRRSPS